MTDTTTKVPGEEDYATPVALAQVLHEGIDGSTFRVVPGARHLTPLERPDVVADELKRLIPGPSGGAVTV